ncbi:MAG: hypothetical protein R3223_01580 [Longimicrobiales bacterium]|nr:hypothetical protein [Longimicrobiales bacterium]
MSFPQPRTPLRISAIPVLLLVLGLVALTPARVDAQVQISGQIDLSAVAGGDDRGVNDAFRRDSPFNPFRARFFAQHWVSDRVGIFTEVLFDSDSGPRLNGAYIVANELTGRSWLNARVGLAPSLIGSFGLRSTYFNSNPLVGIPLVWQYRTTLDGSGLVTADDLLRRKQANTSFLPMLYDPCWNLQWELLGEVGIFEYSAGVTSGSMSNPLGAMEADGVQVLARVGVEPRPGIRIGVSGGVGPYIGGGRRDPDLSAPDFPGGPEDYDQRLFGYDVEWARGRLQLISEGYHSTWEAPLVSEDLTATGAFLEARYDFLPRWTGAARTGFIGFNEITPSGAGATPTGWDDDIARFETALTYRWSREVHVRLDWQHNEFLTGSDASMDLLAFQVRAVF